MFNKEKPKVSSSAEKELDKMQKQFDEFDSNIKEMTYDRMNMAPKQDVEPQTKLSQKDIEKSRDIYLKPYRSIGSREKFNEDYRKQYEFDSEYVQFTAENKEIIGEDIDIWTKPYAGLPAEWWKVPVNKPIWGPRYLAEQIKRCKYHRFSMSNVATENIREGQLYGAMVVDETKQRLDAHPVVKHKSVFMGARNF